MQSFSALRAFLREQAFMFKIPSALVKPHSNLSTQADHVPEIDKAPLLELLVDAWPRDSSDPRDKVYALTSPRLTSTAYAELRPDYDLDMRRTFIRVIRTHVNNTKNLNFLKYAIGTCVLHYWPGRHPRHDGIRALEKGGRWIPLRNRERDPLPPRSQSRSTYHDSGNSMDLLGPGQSISSGSTALSNTLQESDRTSSHEDLPTWVCDWRAAGAQTKVTPLPFESSHPLWKSRGDIPPKTQSIRDFSPRLILRGCALARVYSYTAQEINRQTRTSIAAEYRRLNKFTELPRCALDKSLDGSHQTNQRPAPHVFQIKHLLTAKDLPRSNIPILLLQALLHDQSACRCAADQATAAGANPQGNDETLPNAELEPLRARRHDKTLPDVESNPLRARCLYDTFPRSPVADMDWLFLLDGLAEVVVLRPYIRCGSGTGAETRSKIGFRFVSVCPLAIVGEEEGRWGQASCAYGDIVLF